jgi:7,8-dihydropterin-6-yl-methyl-4-(beta-D-ribofuranosyl)aminobenzene 5'-phosphate synthase
MTTTDRRTFLRTVAAVAGVAATGPGTFTALAAGVPEPTTVDAPLVDSLSIRCVVENRHDIFESTAAPEGIGVERYRLAVGDDMNSSLLSEWGLSLYLETEGGGGARRYLMDFGLNSRTLINNLQLLKIDPTQLDGLVLSHGHMDHFGGLIGFLNYYGPEFQSGLKLHTGGEDVFCQRFFAMPDGRKVPWGALDRGQIQRAGIDLVLADQPGVVDGQLLTSGYVPRTSFENVAPNTVVEFAEIDGLGCDANLANHFSQQELGGEVYLDQHWHEQAACYHVKGKGLVVITSCGHAGLINNIRHLMKVTGVDKVHAVVGGFHLAPTKQEYIDQTVDALVALNPDVVIPMHCTGQKFTDTAAQKLPGRIVLNSSGSRYTFGG